MPVARGRIAKDQPGQEVVLDRLLDLLLVTALPTWFFRAKANHRTG